MKCRGTDRFGRGRAPMQKGRTIGTHEGRRKDRKEGATAAEQRETKRAQSLRNRQHRSGMRLSNGTTHRKGCNSYDECAHKKHWVATGRRTRPDERKPR